MNNKLDAVKYIGYLGYKNSYSPAQAKKCYRALRLLGLNVAQCLEAMRYIEFNDGLLRNVPDLAALPELGLAEDQ